MRRALPKFSRQHFEIVRFARFPRERQSMIPSRQRLVRWRNRELLSENLQARELGLPVDRQFPKERLQRLASGFDAVRSRSAASQRRRRSLARILPQAPSAGVPRSLRKQRLSALHVSEMALVGITIIHAERNLCHFCGGDRSTPPAMDDVFAHGAFV